MALHLNLYHEIAKQKAIERRDPLKFAVPGLVLVAVGLAGYYFLQLNSQRALGNELARLKSEHADLGPKASAAQKRSEEIAITAKLGEALVKRMEDRFHWAPILESFANVVPKEVQITRLVTDVSGDAIKRCNLSMNGVAAGADPRRVAEDLRRALIDEFSTRFTDVTASFSSLEDSPETVTLNGAKLAVATFGINLGMERTAKPSEVATPRTAQK